MERRGGGACPTYAPLIAYEDLTPELPDLAPRPRLSDSVSKEMGYVRPPISDQTFVTDHYDQERAPAK